METIDMYLEHDYSQDSLQQSDLDQLKLLIDKFTRLISILLDEVFEHNRQIDLILCEINYRDE